MNKTNLYKKIILENAFKYIKTLFVFSAIVFSLNISSNFLYSENTKETVIAKIKLYFNNEEATGVIYESSQGRDFLSLLPNTFAFKDFNKSEKISYLNKKLSIDKFYKSTNPSIGDITYYIPWGNIAIFYKDFNYSKDLVKIGKIENGLNKLVNMKTDFNVRIEKVD